MVNQPDLTQFQKRIAERRERQEAEKRAQESTQFKFDEDLIPEHTYDRSEADQQIDQIIDGIDVLASYNKWCRKMVPVVKGGQREGIKISCPIPGHLDADPSAWINLDKQTWFCGGCQVGGDKYDIAAYGLGYPVPGYKEGAEFHRLREQMALDFGYLIQREIGGTVSIIPPKYEPEPSEDRHHEPPSAEVVELFNQDDDERQLDIPTLDWRPVCPPDTFLDRYMRATIIDDVPEEYHFFHALAAVGLALGRDVTLYDSVPIYGNLFICTLGRSGTGKSKARKHLDKLLYTALPYDRAILPSRGVLRVNAPGSAESLIYQFMEPVIDPNNPKKVAYYAPVRGLIDFNELSSLMARTNRLGSAMKPTLMQFYDMDPIVQTTSMTTGSKEAHEPFATCITTSQPKALRELITAADDASGFLNRWVFVPGKEKERFAVGGVAIDMSPCVSPLQEIQAWAATFGPEQIEWSQEAVKIWSQFFHDTLEPERKSSDTDLMVRIDLTLKKLMLLFAANRRERTLSEQSAIDAIYCYPYLKRAYGIPEAQIGNTMNNEISEAVIAQCRRIFEKTKRGATVSEIARNLARRKYDRKRLIEVIDTLVKLEAIEVYVDQAGSKVGRPAKRYKYVG
jgi:hypothetical protein